MTDEDAIRDLIERDFRELLRNGGLAEPDEILPHEDGGIMCFWREQRLWVVIDA